MGCGSSISVAQDVEPPAYREQPPHSSRIGLPTTTTTTSTNNNANPLGFVERTVVPVAATDAPSREHNQTDREHNHTDQERHHTDQERHQTDQERHHSDREHNQAEAVERPLFDSTPPLPTIEHAPEASASMRVVRESNDSTDKPFASASDGEFEAQFDNSSLDHDRSAAQSTGSQMLDVSGDSSPKNRHRSKSVYVLEKISLSRQKEAIEEDKPFEDIVQTASASIRVQDSLSESKRDDSYERRTTVVRTRRLSSIYNEFATSVDAFLKANEGGENEAEEEGSPTVAPAADETSLKKIFHLLDQQQTGSVTQESLVEGFRRMGHAKTLDTLTTYFQCADEDHDGLLQWEEFAKFFRYLTNVDFVSADDADTDVLPPPKPRARNYSTILVSMKAYQCDALPSQAGRIKCTALSQHRNMYAVSHRNDKNVHLYDFNGNKLRILSGHKDSLLGISFSNDRKVVATVSRDAMLILWDCTVGHAVNTVQHPGIVTAVTFSHDGKSIYTGCQDNLVRRFSGSRCHLKAVLDRLPRAELGVTVALACQHHTNKEIVFSRSCDRGAIVADASTLKITTVLEGHKSMVWQAHYRADGTKLLTSCEKFVKVWSTSNYAPLFVLDSERFVSEKGVARNAKPKLWTTASFCPPRYGPMIVVFNTDTNMMFVDSDSGKLILTHNFRSSIYAATVSLDSSIIICGDDWGNMYKFSML